MNNIPKLATYTSVATKRLIKALAEVKEDHSKEYKLNLQLLKYFRENEIKIRDKPLTRELRIAFEREKHRVEISFVAGKYPGTDEVNCRESRKFFPFQVSYNKKYDASLFECAGIDSEYIVLRMLLTDYPIRIRRYSIGKEKEYRGKIAYQHSQDLLKELNRHIKEGLVSQELVVNCINLARDKEERLYGEWVEKIHNFLVS